MKKNLFAALLFLFSLVAYSQSTDTSASSAPVYKIVKTDGGEIIAKILSQDAREIFVLTNDGRKFYVPQHLVKEIILLESEDFNSAGTYIGEDKFATRYFISTNGLPIKKGEHYVKYGLFGPEIQFGVEKNFGVGLITSWIGVPIILTAKKSWTLNKDVHLALGALAGTGSWALISGGGVLPFGSITFGDRRKNISFSAGYGAIFFEGNTEGAALGSVAGMIKVSPKISLVFDSFILLPGTTETNTSQFNPSTGQVENINVRERRPGGALIIPGLRWHQSEGKAFQFGFTAITNGEELAPVFIPSLQWFRTL